MSGREDQELKRAIADADAAEAELRRLKESLITRDRVAALSALLNAELRAVLARETARFAPALHAAQTDDERLGVLTSMSDAIIAGTERVKQELLTQSRAWTIAGLEDRANEGGAF